MWPAAFTAALTARTTAPSRNRLPVATMTRLGARRSATLPQAPPVFDVHCRRAIILTQAATRVYDTGFLTDEQLKQGVSRFGW